MSYVLLPRKSVAVFSEQCLRGSYSRLGCAYYAARHGERGLARYRDASTSQLDIFNIKSEQLCDDALKLLEPSLHSYRRCNIIDISPENCLWSQKIHKLLSPRAHVFVNQPHESRQNSLAELLHTDPTYRFHTLPPSEAEFSPWPEFFHEVMQEFDNVENPSDIVPTLILANFTSFIVAKTSPKKHGKIPRIESPSAQFIYSFLRHCRNNFSEVGRAPPRLLLWLLDRDKFNLLPRSVSHRSYSNLVLEETFFPQEIVGSAELTPTRRPVSLEIESAIETAKRMVSSGFLPNIPHERRTKLHQMALDCANAGANKADHSVTEKINELAQLEIRWSFDDFSRNQTDPTKKDRRKKQLSPDFLRRWHLLNDLNGLMDIAPQPKPNFPREGAQKASICQSLLYDLDRSKASGHPESQLLKQVKSPDNERDFALQVGSHFGPYDRSQIAEKLQELIGLLTADTEAAFHRLVDEYEALRSPEPLLAWDKRAFEPIECFDDDFDPNHKLALLDFVPRVQPPADNYKVMDSIPLVHSIKRSFPLAITEALDKVENGAADAILPDCPTLLDISKGGKPNPHELRVRMLTPPMWKEIVEAWYKWPFRKTDAELLTSQGAYKLVPTHVFPDHPDN